VKKNIETKVEVKVLNSVLKSDDLLSEERVVNLDVHDEFDILQASENGLTLDYNSLAKEDQVVVDSIAQDIVIVEAYSIIDYASDVQGRITELSSSVINNAKTKKVGEIGTRLADLTAQIYDFDICASENKKGIFRIFDCGKLKSDKLMAKYSKTETNIDAIVDALDKNRIQLLKDMELLGLLLDENVRFFKEISLYIIAGEQKAKEMEEIELPKLWEEARKSSSQMDLEKVNDVQLLVNRFKRRIYDLKLSRTISIQMALQIRMLESINCELADKIQSGIINTIPLWKTQISLALGLANFMSGSQVEKRLSVTSVKEETVDIDVIKNINGCIVSMVSEVVKIQDRGEVRRIEVINELESSKK